MRVRIAGTGSALPKRRVTNGELAEFLDTSDEWIASRTGIRSRYISSGEGTTELCVEAAKKALEDAGMEAAELELIVVATLSADKALPNTACEVQRALGADRAAAFELNAACAGFLFALNTVQAYVQAGLCQKALVIGAEVLSKLMDWTDRGTCVLFGDGAGAAAVTACREGVYSFCQGADGSRGEVLSCPGRPIRNPYTAGAAPGPTAEGCAAGQRTEACGYVRMDGREVFRFAVKTVPETILQVLQMSGTSVEEVDWFFLHQANERILTAAAKRLGVPREKLPMNLGRCGNTSSASIPILLDEVNRRGLLRRGQRIVLAGFGAGLTYGAALLEW